MKRKLIVVMILGLLSGGFGGCSSTHWVKQGATSPEIEADYFQCRQDAEKYEHGWYWIVPYAGVFMGATNATRVKNEQDSCMRAKGYTK